MSVININHVKKITAKRQFSTCPKFNNTELRFVAQHDGLRDSEKLLWLLLAHQSLESNIKTFQISDFKLAQITGEKVSSIPIIIKNMEKRGFIIINNHDFMKPRYKLSLPEGELNLALRTPYMKGDGKAGCRDPSLNANSNIKIVYFFVKNVFYKKILQSKIAQSVQNTFVNSH